MINTVLNGYPLNAMYWATKLFSKSKEKNKDGLDWCHLYNQYHNNMYNSSNLQKEVTELLQDDEVKKRVAFISICWRNMRRVRILVQKNIYN